MRGSTWFECFSFTLVYYLDFHNLTISNPYLVHVDFEGSVSQWYSGVLFIFHNFSSMFLTFLDFLCLFFFFQLYGKHFYFCWYRQGAIKSLRSKRIKHNDTSDEVNIRVWNILKCYFDHYQGQCNRFLYFLESLNSSLPSFLLMKAYCEFSEVKLNKISWMSGIFM